MTTSRFRAVTESSAAAIVTTDSAGSIAGWNQAAEVIFGYTAAEIMGQPLELLIPGYRERHLAGINRIQSGRKRHALGKTVEMEGLRRDRTGFPVELSLARWESAEGGFVTGMIRDITERKQAATTMHLQGAALHAVVNAVVITDRAGLIEWVNPAFTRLTGYTPEEAIGKNPRDLVKSGQHAREFYKDLWQTILAGRPWRGEMINRRKDGSLYTENQTVTPILDASGAISHSRDTRASTAWPRRPDPTYGWL